MKNIVLIGFMGSGKTVIAKQLSKILNRQIIDTDDIIEKKQKIKIKKIFELYGENYFRKLESEAVKSAVRQKGKVISTGGGVIARAGNIRELRRNGIIVYLENKFETSLKRLKNKKDRPLFNVAELEKTKLLFNERLPLYKKAADVIVTTDNKTIKEVADEIVRKTVKYI
ncbi:MAG: shikimate kinase [Candidatus Goldbacteria bacterium]|nr:shikimate kinase [Candidatus Goldiibacteriota bacterium]HPD18722.1 shikimate kinase [Candidatus Goldiibacteriota bacterium]